MIPQKYRQLAKEFRLTQKGDQSDDDFMAEIDRLRGNRELIFELLKLGGEVSFGMTSAALRLAICQRQLVVLTERGFTKGAEMFVSTDPERRVRIDEVVLDKSKREPTVTVKYWIIEPWTGKNNQGRANHKSADDVLKNARLAPS